MSKLYLENRVPREYSPLVFAELMRQIATSHNLLAEEKIAAHYRAYTAAPTTGDWAQGDFVRNSAPSEAGSASSKYVVIGWICTASGTPGTWLECRVSTGN
jgi:hypothetical protein